MRLITQHSRDGISNAEQVLAALEYTQEGTATPTLALDPIITPSALAPVYLGGYAAVSNTKWMIEAKVTHVLCAAQGLSMFGKRYTGAITMAQDRGVKFTNLDWSDNATFPIEADLPRVVEVINNARHNGTAILVHCAQGKSRSAACVVAYMMAFMNLGAEAALKILRTRRRMAEPNAGFMTQLKKWEKSPSLSECRRTIQLHLSPTPAPVASAASASSTSSSEPSVTSAADVATVASSLGSTIAHSASSSSSDSASTTTGSSHQLVSIEVVAVEDSIASSS